MHPNFEHGQDIRDRAFLFACRVVGLCEALYDGGGVGRILVPQMVHSSTSCASNLEEARAAESDADFISKCCVSLKECRETWVRLRICDVRKFGPAGEVRELVQEANELVSIITRIIGNKRRSIAASNATKRSAPTPRKTRPRSYEFQVPDAVKRRFPNS